MFRYSRYLSVIATVAAFASAGAQVPAADPSTQLGKVLPPEVAERVLAKIAAARDVGLPAQAIENRVLKFAARGVPAADIERSVNDQVDRMQKAKSAIEKGRGGKARGEEVEAGAEAMRKGADVALVSDLAKSAPSGRSLAVPLFVIGSLMEEGMPAHDALTRVKERLDQQATDRELEGLPGDIAQAKKPSKTGQDLAATKRPANVGQPGTAGPPAGVPANAGKGVSPAGTIGRPRP